MEMGFSEPDQGFLYLQDTAPALFGRYILCKDTKTLRVNICGQAGWTGPLPGGDHDPRIL
jgi:hypothetical protein